MEPLRSHMPPTNAPTAGVATPTLAPPAPPGLERGEVPTFSIVICAYRAEETIVAAVESALGQTVPPHELIVVDDGSPDNTVGVLEPFLDWIVLVRKENGGAASAMNAGARAATAEFVAVLDADDSYLPKRIEALGELAAARPDLDVMTTDLYLEQDGRIVGRRYSEAAPFASEEQRLAILRSNFLSAPAYRRTALLEVGGFDETLRTTYDWDCHIRLLLAGSRAGLVDVPLYRYRIHAGSVSDSRVTSRADSVGVLERASRLPLTSEERKTLQASLRQKRMDSTLIAADAALRGRARDARRRALAIVVGPDFGMGTRAKALVAAVAPRLSARLLEARERRTGWSRLQRL